MKDPMVELFGSSERIKLMRFFLFNQRTIMGALDLAHVTNVNPKTAHKEISLLSGVGFIRKKNFYRTESIQRAGRNIVRKEKVKGWMLDNNFPYLEALEHLLVASRAFQRGAIINRFKHVGRIKLLIVSGIFIHNEHSKVDLLLVGDSLRKSLIKRVLRSLEQEIGKELRYSIMNLGEFLYRRGIYDKFLRDILDYPHERFIDKIGLT